MTVQRVYRGHLARLEKSRRFQRRDIQRKTQLAKILARTWTAYLFRVRAHLAASRLMWRLERGRRQHQCDSAYKIQKTLRRWIEERQVLDVVMEQIVAEGVGDDQLDYNVESEDSTGVGNSRFIVEGEPGREPGQMRDKAAVIILRALRRKSAWWRLRARVLGRMVLRLYQARRLRRTSQEDVLRTIPSDTPNLLQPNQANESELILHLWPVDWAELMTSGWSGCAARSLLTNDNITQLLTKHLDLPLIFSITETTSADTGLLMGDTVDVGQVIMRWDSSESPARVLRVLARPVNCAVPIVATVFAAATEIVGKLQKRILVKFRDTEYYWEHPEDCEDPETAKEDRVDDFALKEDEGMQPTLSLPPVIIIDTSQARGAQRIQVCISSVSRLLIIVLLVYVMSIHMSVATMAGICQAELY
jgi:hypothetical protein